MIKKLIKFISLKIISPINWSKWHKFLFKKENHLEFKDWMQISQLLATKHYVILTRRDTHLTTYLIQLAGLFTKGRVGYWTHAFMNLEGTVNYLDLHQFKFVEAIGKGTVCSTWDEVMNCDSVCLLVPRGISDVEWTEVLDAARGYYGTPYDTLFDLKSDKELSCVELVRDSIRHIPDYDHRFAEFEHMIDSYKNLTPDMFYDCTDFEPALTICKSTTGKLRLR